MGRQASLADLSVTTYVGQSPRQKWELFYQTKYQREPKLR